MADKNRNGTPSEDAASLRTAWGARRRARLARRAEHLRAADELWARVQAAETEERAARERFEALGFPEPFSDSYPEYEEAQDASSAAWVQAEEARHDLDAYLNPKRYATNGYMSEALDNFRVRAETERELEPGP